MIINKNYEKIKVQFLRGGGIKLFKHYGGEVRPTCFCRDFGSFSSPSPPFVSPPPLSASPPPLSAWPAVLWQHRGAAPAPCAPPPHVHVGSAQFSPSYR